MTSKNSQSNRPPEASFFPKNRPLVVQHLAKKARQHQAKKNLRKKADQAKQKQAQKKAQLLQPPPLAGQLIQKEEKNLAAQRDILDQGESALLKFRR